MSNKKTDFVKQGFNTDTRDYLSSLINKIPRTTLSIIKTDYQSMVVSPKEGDNFLRILPPTWDNAEHYGLDIYVHSLFLIDKSRQSVICLKTINEHCPICKVVGKDLASKSRHKILTWVVDKTESYSSVDLKLWAMPWTIDRDIGKILYKNLSMTRDLLKIYDLEHGRNVHIHRNGTGINTRYNIKLAQRNSNNPYNYKVFEYVIDNPLTKCIKIYKTEDLEYLCRVIKL